MPTGWSDGGNSTRDVSLPGVSSWQLRSVPARISLLLSSSFEEYLHKFKCQGTWGLMNTFILLKLQETEQNSRQQAIERLWAHTSPGRAIAEDQKKFSFHGKMLTLIHRSCMKTSVGLKCALCQYPQTPTRGGDRVWGYDMAPGLKSHHSNTTSSQTRGNLCQTHYFPEDNGVLIKTPAQIPGTLRELQAT